MKLVDTILITGGAGFIGSTLANYLGKENKIVVVDDLSMGKKENLDMDKQVTFIEGDVSDSQLMERIMKEYQFAYIFHLAAVASVADSVERPVETHRVNFDSALLLLEFARKYQSNLKRLVFSSSAAVYGDEPTLPKKEESVIRPLTPYAIDKLQQNNMFWITVIYMMFQQVLSDFLTFMAQIKIRTLHIAESFRF